MPRKTSAISQNQRSGRRNKSGVEAIDMLYKDNPRPCVIIAAVVGRFVTILHTDDPSAVPTRRNHAVVEIVENNNSAASKEQTCGNGKETETKRSERQAAKRVEKQRKAEVASAWQKLIDATNESL